MGLQSCHGAGISRSLERLRHSQLRSLLALSVIVAVGSIAVSPCVMRFQGGKQYEERRRAQRPPCRRRYRTRNSTLWRMLNALTHRAEPTPSRKGQGPSTAAVTSPHLARLLSGAARGAAATVMHAVAFPVYFETLEYITEGQEWGKEPAFTVLVLQDNYIFFKHSQDQLETKT